MSEVKLKGITKYFGKFKVLDHLNLDIKDGEFFTLLGPSGCGKTTTLRIMAGFINLDEGEVYFGDNKITQIPAHKRNAGMVFQDYALFPNLTVYENVAYGLKARKEERKVIERKVHSILEKVELLGLENRSPNELSGGQQQRVALARALVIEPEVLLMDEPLSNLDAKLRLNMREVIRRLQKEVGITTIFVTHDQEEAISISDRVAVLRNGHIEQVGTPMDVYRNPKNRFVADFIGLANLLEGEVISYNIDERRAILNIDGEVIQVSMNTVPPSKVLCCVRPEQFEIVNKDESCNNKIKGSIVSILFMGSMIKYKVLAFKDKILSMEKQHSSYMKINKEGDEIFLKISEEFPVLEAEN